MVHERPEFAIAGLDENELPAAGDKDKHVARSRAAVKYHYTQVLPLGTICL
jgi:hypothetical protein